MCLLRWCGSANLNSHRWHRCFLLSSRDLCEGFWTHFSKWTFRPLTVENSSPQKLHILLPSCSTSRCLLTWWEFWNFLSHWSHLYSTSVASLCLLKQWKYKVYFLVVLKEHAFFSVLQPKTLTPGGGRTPCFLILCSWPWSGDLNWLGHRSHEFVFSPSPVFLSLMLSSLDQGMVNFFCHCNLLV